MVHSAMTGPLPDKQKAGDVRFFIFIILSHLVSEKEANVKLEVTKSLLCMSSESSS